MKAVVPRTGGPHAAECGKWAEAPQTTAVAPHTAPASLLAHQPRRGTFALWATCRRRHPRACMAQPIGRLARPAHGADPQRVARHRFGLERQPLTAAVRSIARSLALNHAAARAVMCQTM